MNNLPPTSRQQRAGGFTIAELMAALAIAAVLLTSAAVAINAAMTSFSENRNISDLSQTSRFVVYRMAREIRTAKAITFTGNHIYITPQTNTQNITLAEYDYTGGALKYYQTLAGNRTGQDLIASTDAVKITAYSVTPDIQLDSGGNAYTRSVTISLTLTSGDYVETITTSAALRQNMQY